MVYWRFWLKLNQLIVVILIFLIIIGWQDIYIQLHKELKNQKTGLVVVIIIVQLHSIKPELGFCTGSNPSCGMSVIRDGEDLWQWSQLEIRLHAFRQSTYHKNSSSSSSSSSKLKIMNWCHIKDISLQWKKIFNKLKKSTKK